VIGQHLVWKVGNSVQVRIGDVVILGCGEGLIFPADITDFLQERGFTTLNQVGAANDTDLWTEGWKQPQ
jgi:hypothetical protein